MYFLSTYPPYSHNSTNIEEKGRLTGTKNNVQNTKYYYNIEISLKLMCLRITFLFSHLWASLTIPVFVSPASL